MSIIFAPGIDPAAERYHFYNNTETLIFDKRIWTYYRILPNGALEAQNGVTGIVKIIDKSEVLMRWAVKKCCEKLRHLMLENFSVTGGWDDISLFEILLDEVIKSSKKADKEELDAAGKTGHIAHDWIERYIRAILDDKDERRQELLAKLPLDERASNACVAALGFMAAHNVRWISTERKCFSRLHGYAGTMDGLALVDSCTDPTCCPNAFKDRLTIVDWKTSNYLYIEYLLQTAAYQQAYQEETGETIEDRWIIRLGKDDGEFDPWHVEGHELFEVDFRSFANALALFRSVDTTKTRIDVIQDEKKAVIRAAAKAELDRQRAIKCPKADEYKGVRKKKGCNDTDKMCEACSMTYSLNQITKKTLTLK